VTVAHHTPRLRARWLSVRDVAASLDLTPTWTLRLLRRGTIPGGEMMYRFEGKKGERWHVDAEVFAAWLEARRRDTG
jgi:hypothetical protein